MAENEMKLTFRSDIVWPWGLFFSQLAEYLSGEISTLRKVKIDLVMGDLLTVQAIADGEADVAFTTPPACAAMGYRGVGYFNREMTNLRAIGSIPHDDRMIWAVPADSQIFSINDMADHPMRLVLANKDFPVRFAVERILEAYGTSIDDLEQKGWQIIEESHCLKIPTLVLDGRADAVIHEGRMTPAWMELGKTCRMRYLPVDLPVLEDLEREYGFRKAFLSKWMFPNMETDIPCVDFADWLLFTRNDVAEDFIYLLTKMLIEKRESLIEFHFRGIERNFNVVTCPVDPAQMNKNIGNIPLHKGAERYYKEQGLL
jgi:TRAP transporter TAXI family solute receptor